MSSAYASTRLPYEIPHIGAGAMDQSEGSQPNYDHSEKHVNYSKQYTDNSLSGLHSNAADLTRNWNFERAQSVEEGDAIESRSQGLHRENSIQPLNYETPQNVTLEIAASAPLEYGKFAPPMQLECFQASAGDSATHLDSSHASTHIMGGFRVNGAPQFYSTSPTFYPLANAASTISGITPSSEDPCNYFGYPDAAALSFPDPSVSRFLGLPSLATGGFPAITPSHSHMVDSKSLTEAFQQRELRWCRNLPHNRPPYRSQRLLQPDPSKNIKNPQPPYYPHEQNRPILQSSNGFSAPEPMKHPDMVPPQDSIWMSRSNIPNDFNNPGGRIVSDLKVCPDIAFTIEDQDGSSILPAPLPENVTYQYSTNYPAREPSAIDTLNYIATRPNPEINLGPIDMSCAFVICRITANDCPIMYISDAFSRLTGYSLEESVGRDCRLLQEPTGIIEPALRRRSVDDRTIRHLKRKINARSEVQECLVNYRKGGQPFLNLLSVVPIRWFSDEYNFCVGFQLDLVDSPQAVTGKNCDGSYIVNYRRLELSPNIYDPGGMTSSQNKYPPFKYQNHSNTTTDRANGQSPVPLGTSLDEAILGSSEFLFHIMSTTGVFIYITPSTSAILEYESKELNGSTLSSICHPSDVVAVIRELRDREPGSVVNLLFRIRRKKSGYTWFESLGSVYIESTRNQKHIAFLGKLRVVFAMSRDELMKNGGINDGEIWAKISPSGILLFISSSGSAFLDRRSEGLVGERVQNLLSDDSRAEFENALGIARSGKRVTCKHELQHRRGHLLQAQSTIYPGETPCGSSKPTFLILQIRLLKLGRPIFSFQANATTTRTRKKLNSNTTMRPSIASDSHPRPSPALTRPNHGNRNITTSQSSSIYTRQHTTMRPYLKPELTNIATHNGHIPDHSLLCRQWEHETAGKAIRESCNIFEELNPTRATNWRTELDHLKRRNRLLVEELHYLTTLKRRRKRKRDVEVPEKDCSQCHTKTTPEWRKGPSGNRDLCNSCGLRWAKQNGRITTMPRKSSCVEQNLSRRRKLSDTSTNESGVPGG
ncbi:white collar 1, variant [Blastomyces dermatitidis ATCC 18188]|uniref:White collar 1, variant n=1 Tax=Ajellomyces dermatitidis (strain ATCC 18188 / CBS 674.68) TaxID=653446 RepID=A0A0J9EUR7_AJEDA|nr:white collar 1, variant [Blastomyces dermatitidis ATCC 18188]